MPAPVARRRAAASVVVARTDVLATCAVVVAAAGIALDAARHGTRFSAWGAASALGTAAAAACAASALVWRWRSSGARRVRTRLQRSVLLAALACAAWTVGQGVRALRLATGAQRPGVELVAFAAFPLLAGAAVVLRLRRLEPRRRAVLGSDALVIATSLVYVAWETSLRHGIAGTSTLAGIGLVGVAMLGIAASALALASHLDQRATVVALAAAAISAVALGDVVLAGSGGVPDDAWYLLSLVCWTCGFALAATVAGRAAPTSRDAARVSQLARAAAVHGTAVVALLLAVRAGVVGGSDTGPLGAVLAAAVALGIGVNQVVRARASTSGAQRLESVTDELGGTEERLRAQLDDLPMAVMVVDATGRVRAANQLVAQLTGREVPAIVGSPFLDLVGAGDRERIGELWQRIQRDNDLGRPPEPVYLSFAPPGDAERIVEVDVRVPVRDLDRVVITFADVTRMREESADLERARERFRLAFHGAPIGMVLAHASDGVLVDTNASFAEMLGTTIDRLVGTRIRDLTHPEDWAGGGMWGALTPGGDPLRTEKRYLRADGSHVWARLSVSVLQERDGTFLSIGHVEDITEQRRSAEQLRWAATHDELTRLPNRTRFMAELTERLATAAPGSIAVLFIDLDNFKVVNDSMGHATGDQLLRGMTERLRHVLRGKDMLSRFGGDEFIVMLTDLTPDVSPVVTAERLLAEICRPLLIDGVELFVTGSIGIAVASSPTTTASDLLRDADAAMYRAKARGRDRVEMYAPGAHDATVLALRTAGELRRAVERDEIVPYYQPIIHLDSGVLTGFEVLARWRHPERGLLGADQFLPMAEETGLIADVGAAVLRASLVQLGRWRDRLPGFENLSIAVNVSGRQLLSADFVELVSDALAEAGVPAGSLWLEITETALMSDVKAATVALRELRSIGLHLSVDDFGTGYSSLTYLKRFPVEAIKVDRSFVNGLAIDAEDSTIVEAVVNLGHSLGLQVVAEGVETPLQLSQLRDLGCDRAQGYLFGRPRPAEVIEAERAVRPPG